MKRLRTLCALLLAMIIFTGCFASSEYNNLRVSYKDDKYAPSGYAAIVYKDRIYYVSDEFGVSGIYSMTLQGDDVRLEVENPSVLYLQIAGNTLYFSGLNYISNNTDSWTSVYKHTVYAGELLDSGDIVGVKSYTDKDIKWNGINAADFYVSESGQGVILGSTFDLWERYYFDFKNERTILGEEIIKKDNDVSSIFSDRQKLCGYEFSDFKLIALNNEEGIYDASSAVFDKNIKEIFLTHGQINNTDELLVPITVHGGNIYYEYIDRNDSQIISILVVNGDTLICEKEYDLSDFYAGDDIIYCWIDNERTYALVQNSAEDFNRDAAVETERVVELDLAEGKSNAVYECTKGERVVGVNENRIICCSKDSVYTVDLNSNNKSVLIDSIAFMNNAQYTFEYAGDWMLIYQNYGTSFTSSYAGDDMGQQLMYKVNLATGEIIENDLEIDFSELDEYKDR